MNRKFGWILGQPGTGKSATALAFASTLVNEGWTVTWINLRKDRGPVCLKFKNNLRKSFVGKNAKDV